MGIDITKETPAMTVNLTTAAAMESLTMCISAYALQTKTHFECLKEYLEENEDLKKRCEDLLKQNHALEERLKPQDREAKFCDKCSAEL